MAAAGLSGSVAVAASAACGSIGFFRPILRLAASRSAGCSAGVMRRAEPAFFLLAMLALYFQSQRMKIRLRRMQWLTAHGLRPGPRAALAGPADLSGSTTAADEPPHVSPDGSASLRSATPLLALRARLTAVSTLFRRSA